MTSNEDNDLARVLRAAGKRDEPPEDFAREARAALHAEWAGMVAARRSKHRRWAGIAAAAGVAAIAAGLWMTREAAFGSSREIGKLDRIVGEVTVDRGWLSASRRGTAPEPLHEGDEVTVARAAGAALALNGGVQVRLDSDTRITLARADLLSLPAGAAYVDTASGAEPAVSALRIETRFGAIRHLGTQYEVRIADQHMQVSVREGRVELTGTDGVARTAASGERLMISADGGLTRDRIGSDSGRWEWASTLAVPFAIQDRPLTDFLGWAARELGREIEYATPETEAEARRIILRGSVSQLAPQAALAAVLATTPLYSRDDGRRIVIDIDRR